MKARTIHLLSNAGMFASLAFIPNIANDLGASSTQIGFIVALYSFTFLLSSWVFGRAADIFGRRRIIQFGLLAASVAILLQMFAWSPFTLGLSRALAGFALGSFPAAVIAYAYEEGDRMGRFSSFAALGWGVGVLSAGIFTAASGKFLASSILVFVAFLVSLAITRDVTIPHKVPVFPVSVIRKNLRIYSAILIRHTGASMIWMFFPLYMESLGASHLLVGIVYAVNASGQFVIMPIADRYRAHPLILAGLISSFLTFLTFAIAQNPYQLIPTQLALAMSWSLTYVGCLKYITKNNVERATASGMLGAAVSAAAIVGPLLAGISVHFVGYRWTIVIAAFVASIALLQYLATGWLAKRDKTPGPLGS